MKPGWKTTEFWLSLVATIVGVLLASGVFTDDSWAAKALGVAAATLSALGYTWARGSLKSGEMEVYSRIEANRLGKSGPTSSTE